MFRAVSVKPFQSLIILDVYGRRRGLGAAEPLHVRWSDLLCVILLAIFNCLINYWGN